MSFIEALHGFAALLGLGLAQKEKLPGSPQHGCVPSNSSTGAIKEAFWVPHRMCWFLRSRTRPQLRRRPGRTGVMR